MDLGYDHAASIRVFVLIRASFVRLGIETWLKRLDRLEVGSQGPVQYRDFAALGAVDLLLADVSEDVQSLMQVLPESQWPKRVLLLSPGDAPAQGQASWPREACGLLSLQDDQQRAQLLLMRALECHGVCGLDRRCGTCPLRKTLSPPALPLSPRELDIFRLVALGLGATDIAAKMGISIKTYETYRERIKLKLGVHNSADLIGTAIAWKRGYLGLWSQQRRRTDATMRS